MTVYKHVYNIKELFKLLVLFTMNIKKNNYGQDKINSPIFFIHKKCKTSGYSSLFRTHEIKITDFSSCICQISCNVNYNGLFQHISI